MKIKFNQNQIFELTEHQKLVIQNDINLNIFDSDMIRRAKWAIENPLELVIDLHRNGWRQELLSRGLEFVPTDGYALYESLRGPSSLMPIPVFFDDKEAFQVSSIQRKMIEEFYDSDSEKYCREKVQWILSHKYDRCMDRFRKEWEHKISKEMQNIPSRDEEFVSLIKARPEYRNKYQLEMEEKTLLN